MGIVPGMCLFLSTPSARRATSSAPTRPSTPCYFYPRPPRGGRLDDVVDHVYKFKFLSTPSARRATLEEQIKERLAEISIHALREEGDLVPPARSEAGGLISIHALREEGDAIVAEVEKTIKISIHALREEGDSKNRDKISIFL